MAKTAFAFLIAPIVGVIASVFIVLKMFDRPIDGWWGYAFIGSLIAYASALMFGLPLYSLARRFGRMSLWLTIAGAFLCSLPAWLAAMYPFNGPYFEREGLFEFVLYATAGVASGILFWLVARPPMRSNPPLNSGRAKGGAPIS